MSTAKAAQIQNTLSSLTPVHEVIHSHANQYHHHHPHLNPGAAGHPGGLHVGQVPDHQIISAEQVQHGGVHNFTVDSLMTAQQQHLVQQQQQHQHQQSGEALGSSREGSPVGPHHATPPLNCAEEGVAYRAAAAAAAMASWTTNCSQNNYNQPNSAVEDHPTTGGGPTHIQEGGPVAGVPIDNHVTPQHHANYRAWYAIPPSAGSPVNQVGGDPYHHSTTPPSTSSTTPTSFNTPTNSRPENYGSNSSAAAAAAAAAAVYRSSMFHYNQDCSTAAITPATVAGAEIHKY